jgi:hypothetical protein
LLLHFDFSCRTVSTIIQQLDATLVDFKLMNDSRSREKVISSTTFISSVNIRKLSEKTSIIS